MLVLETLGVRVVNVVLLGQTVQTIDPFVSPFQTFLELGAGSQVLITWNVPFNAGLGQNLLNVHPVATLSPFTLADCSLCCCCLVKMASRQRSCFVEKQGSVWWQCILDVLL